MKVEQPAPESQASLPPRTPPSRDSSRVRELAALLDLNPRQFVAAVPPRAAEAIFESGSVEDAQSAAAVAARRTRPANAEVLRAVRTQLEQQLRAFWEVKGWQDRKLILDLEERRGIGLAISMTRYAEMSLHDTRLGQLSSAEEEAYRAARRRALGKGAELRCFRVRVYLPEEKPRRPLLRQSAEYWGVVSVFVDKLGRTIMIDNEVKRQLVVYDPLGSSEG
jgi:hypothetical protein